MHRERSRIVRPGSGESYAELDICCKPHSAGIANSLAGRKF